MDTFINFFLQFHSGWRFLVFLVTLLTILFFAYALATKSTSAKRETTFLKMWAGVVDMQVTLGIILAALFIIDGRWYGALMGHVVMGMLIMVVGHIPAIYQRLNGEPSAQVRRIMGVALPIAVIVLAIIGILSIRDGVFMMTKV